MSSSSYKIIRIPIVPFGIVNCHLIKSESSCILIDTGLPGSEDKIGQALSQNGLNFSNIELIIITHAHNDHAGSASRLRELTKAPIVGHQGDVDYYLQKKPMTFCSTGYFGNLFLKLGVPLEPYEAFEPDILLKDQEILDLSTYGFQGGKVFHSGGHTPGSIAIEFSNGGDAFVGDLVVSGILLGGIAFHGRTIRPPFEDDPKKVAQVLQDLVQRGSISFHLGHGYPLGASAIKRHAKSLFKLLPPSS